MSSAPAKPRGKRRPARRPPVEVLLALACLASALVLGLSELLTSFELTPPGGEPLQVLDAGDRHGYGLLILAFFAVFALALTVLSGSKAAAYAVAVAGGVALLIFLIGDLPRAGQIGTLDDPRQSFIDVEAVPQAGFWLELIGALGLAVSGAALATLTPEQLSFGGRWLERRRERREDAERARTNGKGEDAKAPAKRRRQAEAENQPERVKDRVERARRTSGRKRGD